MAHQVVHQLAVITGLSEGVSHYFIKKINKAVWPLNLNLYTIQASTTDVIELFPAADDLFVYLKELIEQACLPHSAILTIPCNSVHIVSERIEAVYSGFLPIHKVTVNNIEHKQNSGSVLLLGTSTTIQSKIYQNLLNEKNRQWIIPTVNEQSWIDSLIFNQLVKQRFDNNQYRKLYQLQQGYLKNGRADHVIIACTDLCYFNQKFSKTMPWQTDSLDSLVAAIVGKMERLNHAS